MAAEKFENEHPDWLKQILEKLENGLSILARNYTKCSLPEKPQVPKTLQQNCKENKTRDIVSQVRFMKYKAANQ